MKVQTFDHRKKTEATCPQCGENYIVNKALIRSWPNRVCDPCQIAKVRGQN